MISFTIMKKEILIIVIKLLIVSWIFLLGVFALTSCSASSGVFSSGRATIISVDTTVVKHSGFIKSKNYVPYD